MRFEADQDLLEMRLQEMMHPELNLVFGGRDPTWGASKNGCVSEALEVDEDMSKPTEL